MPKLTDITNCGSLIAIKSAHDKLEQEERAIMEKRHKEQHIFSTYEEALDWLVVNPDKSINWHCWPMHWDEEKQKFVSYEQDFGYDGIIPTDVIHYYTREERLKGYTLEDLKEYEKFLDEKYPELGSNENWWLDEYGKLDYVYAYDHRKYSLWD